MPSAEPVSLSVLLEHKEVNLTLQNMSEKEIKEIKLDDNRIQITGLLIAGFTNRLHQERLQLFGPTEMEYLDSISYEERLEKTEHFLSKNPRAVIFSYSQKPPDFFIDIANKYKVPLFTTSMGTVKFLDYATDYLNKLLAIYTVMHSQLLDVFGVGMLIIGDSGVGKSEASMDLVMRGHTLIADDVTEIRYIPPEHLIGSANEMMRNLVEIRGIGLVDLQRMFGVISVGVEKEIDIVVKLVLYDEIKNFEYERLGSTTRYYEILSIKKPYYVIPVRHGSNLSSLMEAISRDYLLKRQGINIAEEFEKKLERKLNQDLANND